MKDPKLFQVEVRKKWRILKMDTADPAFPQLVNLIAQNFVIPLKFQQLLFRDIPISQ